MRRTGLWLLVGSITAVQLGAAVAKGLFEMVDPVTLVWLRLTTATLILLAVARPRIRGRSARDWATVLAFGAAFGIMNLALYQAISRIPLGTAVTIEFLGPLTVAVLGSRRLRDWLWIVLAGLGVALLGFSPTSLDPVGVAYAGLAAVAWGSYILLNRRTGQRWEGVSGLAMATFVAAALSTPLMLIFGEGGLDLPQVWLVGAAVGLLSTVVPYSLEVLALRRIPPGLFGILMSAEPAVAALAAMAVIGEFLTPIQWVAVACVVIASFGAIRFGEKPATVAPAPVDAGEDQPGSV